MSLKEKLNIDWEQAKQNGSQFGEVKMFESMRNYFVSKGCAVVKTHQNIVQNTQTNKKCEISDLLIVSYSRHYPDQLKVTFLQAKRATSQNGLTKNDTAFKFQIDTRQYRLLKDCPKINPLDTNFDPNILLDSCSPSITSYGVFYESQGKLDFAYEITQLLKIKYPVPVTPCSRICYFDSVKDEYAFLRWRAAFLDVCHRDCFHCICCHPISQNNELISTISADVFEKELFGFKIGSPLCFDYHSRQIKSILEAVKNGNDIYNSKNINDFITLVENGLMQSGENSGSEIANGESDDYESLKPTYILLVNADEFRTE